MMFEFQLINRQPTRSVPDWMWISSNPACSEAKPYPAARAAERPYFPGQLYTPWLAKIRERTDLSKTVRYAVTG